MANAAMFPTRLNPILGGSPESTRDAEMVHIGYQTAYFVVREDIFSFLQSHFGSGRKTSIDTVYFVGHSLGGALAHLCLLDFSRNAPASLRAQTVLRLCTFGAPAVGNAAFARGVRAAAGAPSDGRADRTSKRAAITLFSTQLDPVPSAFQRVQQVQGLVASARRSLLREEERQKEEEEQKDGEEQFVHCVAPTELGLPGGWMLDLVRTSRRLAAAASSSSSPSSPSPSSPHPAQDRSSPQDVLDGVFGLGKLLTGSARLLLDAHGVEEYIRNLELRLASEAVKGTAETVEDL